MRHRTAATLSFRCVADQPRMDGRELGAGEASARRDSQLSGRPLMTRRKANGWSRSAARSPTRVGSRAKTLRLNISELPATRRNSPQAAAELVRLKVDVIFADSAPALRAAYAATPTIPIVASGFHDRPVAEGYVESYGRPGGNITGVFLDAPGFAGKWFELLKAIVPDLSRVCRSVGPEPGPCALAGGQRVARSSGVQLQVIEVRKPATSTRLLCVPRTAPGSDHPAFANDVLAERTTRQADAEAPAARDIDGPCVCRSGRCDRLRPRIGVSRRALCRSSWPRSSVPPKRAG